MLLTNLSCNYKDMIDLLATYRSVNSKNQRGADAWLLSRPFLIIMYFFFQTLSQSFMQKKLPADDDEIAYFSVCQKN